MKLHVGVAQFDWPYRASRALSFSPKIGIVCDGPRSVLRYDQSISWRKTLFGFWITRGRNISPLGLVQPVVLHGDLPLLRKSRVLCSQFWRGVNVRRARGGGARKEASRSMPLTLIKPKPSGVSWVTHRDTKGGTSRYWASASSYDPPQTTHSARSRMH